jgi:hypothetical protein
MPWDMIGETLVGIGTGSKMASCRKADLFVFLRVFFFIMTFVNVYFSIPFERRTDPSDTCLVSRVTSRPYYDVCQKVITCMEIRYTTIQCQKGMYNMEIRYTTVWVWSGGGGGIASIRASISGELLKKKNAFWNVSSFIMLWRLPIIRQGILVYRQQQQKDISLTVNNPIDDDRRPTTTTTNQSRRLQWLYLPCRLLSIFAVVDQKMLMKRKRCYQQFKILR